MKNVRNLSLMAIVAIALVGAFAFKKAPVFATEYAVSGDDGAGSWIISESLAGEALGVDYLCNNVVTQLPCKVESNLAPVGGKIDKDDATPIAEQRQYQDLTPNDGD